MAVGVIVRGEEKAAAGHGKVRRTGAPRARVDILDEDGADTGTIGFPEFDSPDVIVGGKIKGAIELDKGARVGMSIEGTRGKADVFHENGAALAAVGLPEFAPGGPVIRPEQDLPVQPGEKGRLRIAGTGIDVLHQDGSAKGAVRLPEFLPVGAVVDVEVEDVSDRSERSRVKRRGRTRIDVLHQLRPQHRAVGFPEFDAGQGVARGENQGVVDQGDIGGVVSGRVT